MSKAIIHVNRQHIAMNSKDGGDRPVFTIKIGSRTRYARDIEVNGKLTSNRGQLKCGAKVWLECDVDDLTMIDEMSFAEARAAA